MVDDITKDIDEAAKELEVAVVGGHMGYAVGSTRPIVVVTAIGVGRRDEVLTSACAHPGDTVYVTKGAGVEGTAILASDFRDVLLNKGVSEEVIERAELFMREISVVREAVALAKSGAVSAMHDATRGGVAEASGCIVEVWEDNIPVREETRIFADTLDFDPLWMISSGTLVFTGPKDRSGDVKRVLNSLGIDYAETGEVKEGEAKTIIHRKKGLEA